MFVSRGPRSLGSARLSLKPQALKAKVSFPTQVGAQRMKRSRPEKFRWRCWLEKTAAAGAPTASRRRGPTPHDSATKGSTPVPTPDRRATSHLQLHPRRKLPKAAKAKPDVGPLGSRNSFLRHLAERGPSQESQGLGPGPRPGVALAPKPGLGPVAGARPSLLRDERAREWEHRT